MARFSCGLADAAAPRSEGRLIKKKNIESSSPEAYDLARVKGEIRPIGGNRRDPAKGQRNTVRRIVPVSNKAQNLLSEKPDEVRGRIRSGGKRKLSSKVQQWRDRVWRPQLSHVGMISASIQGTDAVMSTVMWSVPRGPKTVSDPEAGCAGQGKFS